MFWRNDGWFSSSTTKGASSNTKRRSERRSVSNSGRIAKAGALEGRQAVAELDPADVVAEPGMVRGRKCPRRIETARGDVDEVGRVEVLVRKRRSAAAAELAYDLRRRFV